LRLHSAAILELDRRVEDHQITRFHAIAHFNLRSEIACDRDFPNVSDTILDDGDLESVAIEDDGFRRH